MTTNDTPIRVHGAWDGWQHAEVRFADLEDVHWLHPHGAPHALIHAYISCGSISAGEIPHDCSPRSAPHRLRICVLKRHATPSAYAALIALADGVRTREPAAMVLASPR
jgi:hypothetical protein